MTTNEIYEKLRDLDAGIARAFKNSFSGGRSSFGSISKREARQIFAKAIDGERITPGEADAMALIIENARMRDDAREWLIDKLDRKAARLALYEGAGELIVDGTRLQKLRNALKVGVVGRINFKSPGTGIYYRPSYYRVVDRLITEDRIDVYHLNARSLQQAIGGAKGTWRSTSNEMYIIAGLSNRYYCKVVVHEATHVIQDWLDIRSRVKYVEADAFIAGGIVLHELGRSRLNNEGPQKTAFDGCSKMVYEEDSIDFQSRQWKDAYAEVVDAIVDSDGYSHKANDRRNYKKRERKNEKRRFRRILRSLRRERGGR